MFEEIESLIKERLLEDNDLIEGKKGHEYLYLNRKVPSVTTILSRCIHEESLMSWANYLGFKRIKYRDRLNEAAMIGTAGHEAIENFLSKDIISENIPLKGFIIWWNILIASNSVKLLGMEERMILSYCGGTYDILLQINDRIYLVDLKTSNHITYKYFIQLAAYRHLIYKTKGINIDGCIILQLDKEEPGFQEYLLDFSIDEHYQFIEQCAFTFISLVLSYYNIAITEKAYKNIFK